MKGRTPIPTAVLEISGAFRKDPQRAAARAHEPKPSGAIGAPPAHWENPSSYPKGALAAIWREYEAEAPPGVLTISDRKQLEQLCIATYESRRPGKQQIRWSAEVTKILRLLGMNPSDRVRVRPSAQELPKESTLRGFIDRKKTA